MSILVIGASGRIAEKLVYDVRQESYSSSRPLRHSGCTPSRVSALQRR
jgi:hypothetical protein